VRRNSPLGALIQPVDHAHLLRAEFKIVHVGVLGLVSVRLGQRGEAVDVEAGTAWGQYG
jgi:hypothetical protein